MMNENARGISSGLDHFPFCQGEHVCLIFRNEEERRSIVCDYLSSGLNANAQMLSIVDTTSMEEFADIMREHGVDPREHEAALSIQEAFPTYCPDGTFAPQRLMASFRSADQESIEKGCSGWRGTGEMSWALTEGRASMDAMIDYECSLNVLLRDTPITAFCQYDVNRFDGATLLDVMTVHPRMIIGGQLMNNPMYLEPEAFAAKYRQS